MKTLIIGDIHNRIEYADAMIAEFAERPLLVVFLGDYFDDFGDSDANAEITARWLKNKMDNQPEGVTFTFLIGNHDLPYFFPELGLGCSGFTKSKYIAIQSIMPERKYRDQLHLHTWVGEYLVTHAGLTRPLAEPMRGYSDVSFDASIDLTLIGHRKLMDREESWAGESALLQAGTDRGGDNAHGGILWCDFNSIVPIPGLKQICGHTPGKRARHKQTDEHSSVTCIDTHTTSAAIYDHETKKMMIVEGNFTVSE